MISIERRQSVIDHIASVPKLSSHHSRAQSPYRQYLSHGLNISSMYTLYLDWLKDNNIDVAAPVSEHYYRDVFNEHNIGFEPPRTDTCDKCDLITNELRKLNAEEDLDEINRLKEEKEQHLSLKNTLNVL